jgi:hypothetical protein
VTKKDKFIGLVQTYALAAVVNNKVMYTVNSEISSANEKLASRAVLCAMELRAKSIPYDTKNPNKLLDAVSEFCDWVFSKENPQYKPEWLS